MGEFEDLKQFISFSYIFPEDKVAWMAISIPVLDTILEFKNVFILTFI